MDQPKPHGVEEIAVDRNRLFQGGGLLEATGWSLEWGKNPVRSSVKGVADDGVSDGGKMDTNLMGPSGFDLHLDQSEMPIARLESFQHAIV